MSPFLSSRLFYGSFHLSPITIPILPPKKAPQKPLFVTLLRCHSPFPPQLRYLSLVHLHNIAKCCNYALHPRVPV